MQFEGYGKKKNDIPQKKENLNCTDVNQHICNCRAAAHANQRNANDRLSTDLQSLNVSGTLPSSAAVHAPPMCFGALPVSAIVWGTPPAGANELGKIRLCWPPTEPGRAG